MAAQGLDSDCLRGRLENREAISRAIAAGRPVATLLVRAGTPGAEVEALVAQARARGIPVSTESEREMRRMSPGDHSPEVLAVVGAGPTPDLDELMRRDGLVLVLAGLRYPANVGFILRSAEVAGAAGVVVANHWTGSEWEEARRVSMRADRFLSVIQSELGATLRAARSAGRRIVAVETNGDSRPWEVDLAVPLALLIGGETTGLPDLVLAAADAVVRIPSRGFIPSYNVQAATGILLGEYLRQTSG